GGGNTGTATPASHLTEASSTVVLPGNLSSTASYVVSPASREAQQQHVELQLPAKLSGGGAAREDDGGSGDGRRLAAAEVAPLGRMDLRGGAGAGPAAPFMANFDR
ncbi:unnamed protein product, partial [Ectocarpus sp. 12 AP-2014]